uniref:Uncharacterized protein n=1 Tax=Arundo donax TaxID=35708 RepID=A0A0A9EN16_ARUDO
MQPPLHQGNVRKEQVSCFFFLCKVV